MKSKVKSSIKTKTIPPFNYAEGKKEQKKEVFFIQCEYENRKKEKKKIRKKGGNQSETSDNNNSDNNNSNNKQL